MINFCNVISDFAGSVKDLLLGHAVYWIYGASPELLDPSALDAQ